MSPKIGLALGGGALRGLAHIGALQVFAEEGLKVYGIAGTSLGALVGAIFAMGGDMKMLEQYCYTFEPASLFDVSESPLGILQGDLLQNLILTLTHDGSFADTKIPLAVMACDLNSGRSVLLNEGKIHEAVRASMSVPGVFPPFARGNSLLADGGLMGRLPEDAARGLGVDIVVAVDIPYRQENALVRGRAETLLRAFDIAQSADLLPHSADILLCPDCPDVDPLNFDHADAAIDAGRKTARAALPEIHRLIKKADKQLRQNGYIGKLPRVRVEGETIIREKKMKP